LESTTARAYRRIFASYSHKDEAIVRQFERLVKVLGDEFLRDAVQLRCGEVWEQRLLRMIDEADIFQLFWSWNALQSEFVRKEWEYALGLKRPHFIRPTYWEEPLPAAPERNLPPEELRRLHFQRLVLEEGRRPSPPDFAPVSDPSSRAAPPHPSLCDALRPERDEDKGVSVAVSSGPGAGEAPLSWLSDEQRGRVEAWVADLENSWDEKRLASVVRRLSSLDDPIRLVALQELVRVDLEHQWRHGRRVRLEAYLRAWPEIGTPETVPAYLIQTEINARARAGEPIDMSKFAGRFPGRRAELAMPAETEGIEGDPLALSTRGSILSIRREAPESVRASGTETAIGALKQIGRYKIVRLLGRGGVGEVYLALDTQADCHVALKVPRFAPEDGPEILARFQRGARLASALTHPNICPVYEIGEADGVHYVATAYIEGRPLSELIQGRKLPPRSAAAIVRKLAHAMEEAHSKNVIHRDLKPANVMINHRNEPIIMDFGLGRRVNETVELTRRGSMVGTPAYMSPEQIRGKREEIGPSCDIYSLGVMLYELITGQLPFQGPLPTIIGQVLTRDPDPPSQLCPEVDPQIERICLMAMAKKPQDRYASMTELAASLGHYLKADSGRPGGDDTAALTDEAMISLAEGNQPMAGPPASISGVAGGLATRVLAELKAERETVVPSGLETPASYNRQPPAAGPVLWPWLVAGGVLLLIALCMGAFVAFKFIR
jgi:predicted Ser/Thr protein kinase